MQVFTKKTFGNLFLFILPLLIFIAGGSTSAYSDVTVLSDGWQYRVGDSPLNSEKIPLWILSENEDSLWKPITVPADVPDRGSHNIIWFRIKLPDAVHEYPAVHLAGIDQCFSLYIAGKNIYTYGNEKEFLSAFGTHIVPLEIYRHKYLYMRVYSGWERLGMYSNKLEIGSRSEIEKKIISFELKFIILAAFLIIAGLIIISAAFFKVEPFQFLSVGLFSILIGIYTLLCGEAKFIFFGNNYIVWGIAELLTLNVFPVFLNIFICLLFKCSRKNPFTWVTLLLVAYAFFALGAAILNRNLLVEMVQSNIYIIALFAFSLIVFSLYYSIKKDIFARLILFTVLIIGCFSAYDVLQAMGIFPVTFLITPWGQLLSIIVLTSIIIMKGLQSTRNLISLENELEIARRIQQSIIPAEIPAVPGISLSAQFKPVTAVGGDLYDFYADEPGGLGILIADVAGHGVPAALIASMVNVAFFMHQHCCADPVRMLESINTVLLKKCEKFFVTALYMYISPGRTCVRFARAGHLPLVILRRQNNHIDSYLPGGRILGRFTDIGAKEQSVVVAPGDRIFLYSDGIPESRNSKGEMFGQERFYNAILKSALCNADECGRLITDEACTWAGSPGNDDDLTLLVIDIKVAEKTS